MDPKTLYWTGAWLNMAAVVGLALWGVRAIKTLDIDRHRRRMQAAALLIVGFVLSYGVKLAFLGREEIERWDPSFVWVLRIHELCVLAMVVCGALALRIAHRTGLVRGIAPSEVEPGSLALHRKLGGAAVVSGALGLCTAAWVLYGMFARLA